MLSHSVNRRFHVLKGPVEQFQSHKMQHKTRSLGFNAQRCSLADPSQFVLPLTGGRWQQGQTSAVCGHKTEQKLDMNHISANASVVRPQSLGFDEKSCIMEKMLVFTHADQYICGVNEVVGSPLSPLLELLW